MVKRGAKPRLWRRSLSLRLPLSRILRGIYGLAQTLKIRYLFPTDAFSNDVLAGSISISLMVFKWFGFLFLAFSNDVYIRHPFYTRVSVFFGTETFLLVVSRLFLFIFFLSKVYFICS